MIFKIEKNKILRTEKSFNKEKIFLMLQHQQK
jgi:hypothetical protein